MLGRQSGQALVDPFFSVTGPAKFADDPSEGEQEICDQACLADEGIGTCVQCRPVIHLAVEAHEDGDAGVRHQTPHLKESFQPWKHGHHEVQKNHACRKSLIWASAASPQPAMPTTTTSSR